MKPFGSRHFAALATATILISNTVSAAEESNGTNASKPDAVCASPFYRTCKGTFGDNCYSAGDGQSCTDGLVCNRGFQACIIGKIGTCYDPAKYTCGRIKTKVKYSEDAMKFIKHERKPYGDMDYVWFYNSSWRDILVTIHLTYPSGSGSIDAVAPAHSLVPLHAGSPSDNPFYPAWSYTITKAIFIK